MPPTPALEFSQSLDVPRSHLPNSRTSHCGFRKEILRIYFKFGQMPLMPNYNVSSPCQRVEEGRHAQAAHRSALATAADPRGCPGRWLAVRTPYRHPVAVPHDLPQSEQIVVVIHRWIFRAEHTAPGTWNERNAQRDQLDGAALILWKRCSDSSVLDGA
jgi:hypothetical protein